MSEPVQVMVYHQADDYDQVLVAYLESSRRMAGTPGLLGNELQQGVADRRSFAVVSRWSGWDEFATWERSPGHQEQTAPLRPFRDHSRARPFEVFRVAARHGDPFPDGGR
ncbi:heme-degrading monooxygenase HmoA [Actinoplanes octamycinicus]|uniref:Heme-degrading monooxygenase HmoA n=1 Tax=Actinoplanes octamycinicus TaxID=135948 RepID=A0A7W7H3J1_9ACTN|nr:antibiotic biosynthesis monooxygenase [Actinoplanes octamycinicus]MBB4743320.1 heme-degrading monooxygenase HmoA [Actinoplanes octamycinicus]GIE61836.1 antibiotic biosynthesis monooxygenase [Actinoplanes octamycinicus]